MITCRFSLLYSEVASFLKKYTVTTLMPCNHAVVWEKVAKAISETQRQGPFPCPACHKPVSVYYPGISDDKYSALLSFVGTIRSLWALSVGCPPIEVIYDSPSSSKGLQEKDSHEAMSEMDSLTLPPSVHVQKYPACRSLFLNQVPPSESEPNFLSALKASVDPVQTPSVQQSSSAISLSTCHAVTSSTTGQQLKAQPMSVATTTEKASSIVKASRNSSKSSERSEVASDNYPFDSEFFIAEITKGNLVDSVFYRENETADLMLASNCPLACIKEIVVKSQGNTVLRLTINFVDENACESFSLYLKKNGLNSRADNASTLSFEHTEEVQRVIGILCDNNEMPIELESLRY